MTAGAVVKGWPNKTLTTYADGYALGTNKEPPYAYLVLTTDITFGGFSADYPTGTEGLLIFVQDGTGGHVIDWDGQLTFVGSSSINLAASSVTAIDVIKTPVGWTGFRRDIPTASFVTSVNSQTGTVALDAGDIPVADLAGYFVATDVEAALAEMYLTVQALPTPPLAIVTTAVTSFDLLQQHAQKVVRMTNAFAGTVQLNRVNFNPATMTTAEFVVTNRGTSTVTFVVDGSVSLSYINPGVSLVLNPGQTLLFRYTGDNGSIMTFDVESYQAGTTTGLSVLQSATPSAARTVLGMDVLTSPLVSYVGKNFDGSTMYLNATAASIGISDGKLGTLYMHLRFANAASTTETLIASPRFSVVRNSAGNIVVLGTASGGSPTVLSIATANAPCAAAGTYSLLISWDLTTAGTGRLYVNDVSDYTEAAYTNTNIQYSNGSWYVGASTSATNKFAGDMYVLYFDPTARATFNTVATRRKFIDSNNVSQFLGRQGQLPTGAQIGLFHAYNASPNWKNNRGSFSFTWTDNGTPTVSAVALYGQYHELGTSSYVENSILPAVDQTALLTTLTGLGTGAPGTEVSLRVRKQTIVNSAYGIVASDSNGHLFHPAADTSARTITIPANGTIPLPIGTEILIDNDIGAGVLTIAITTDTLVLVGAGTTGSRTLAAGGQASLLKVTSTRWRITNINGLT